MCRRAAGSEFGTLEKLAEGVGNAPTSAMPILFSRRVQPAYICLPSKLAARVGLAPTPCGLTNRRATLTPPGNGAAGRIPTCIVPFRRRMPHVFGHGSDLKLVSAAGFAPAVTRSQAGHVAATPRAVRPGVLGAHRGLCFMEIAGPTHLEPVSRGKNRNWRTRR